MIYRDQLIAAMARGYTGAPFPSKRAIARSAIALDAALDLLETPSEEMLAEGSCELHHGRPGTVSVCAVWQSMLATLRSPKI